MDLLRIVIFLVTFYQILSGHAINAISLSKEEDAVLQRELQAINKPAVKTIMVRESVCVLLYSIYLDLLILNLLLFLQTKHGDIYDCVNIYKQPALDHPLVKNHKV
jgi:hypothetical protein